MKFINQHSYFVFAGTVLVGAALILGAGGMTTSRLLVLLGLAFVLAAVYLIFYPGRGRAQRTQRGIGSGKPVLLEFQSRF
jgi:Flp pilus assembly protein TadB